MAKQAKMVIQTNVVPPITLPTFGEDPHTALEIARVMQAWWEQTEDREDGLADWREMASIVQSRWGFAMYDAATWLRETAQPGGGSNDWGLLGRWGMGEPYSDRLALHPYLRQNPGIIYEAVRKAEAALGMALTPNPYDGSQDDEDEEGGDAEPGARATIAPTPRRGRKAGGGATIAPTPKRGHEEE